MRISTSMFHNQDYNSIQNHQQDVLDTQLKSSTGKKVNAPSDDPVATSQIHSLNSTMNTIDQYATNGVFAKSQLVQEETAIEDTVDSLQKARELTIQMLNGTYSAADRMAAGEEVNQLIQQVQNSMNYKNSDGELLFAGNSVFAEKAFVEDVNNPGYFAYVGSANAIGQFESDGVTPVYDSQANFGARFVQIGFDSDNSITADDQGDPSRVKISDNGQDVFNITTTTTFAGTPDENILNVLVELKNALLAGNEPPQGIAEDLKTGIDSLSQVRAEIGGRQNRIESQYDAGEEFKIALKERRMGLEDMDVVQGVTDLTQAQTALQMAQQVFVSVQEMSLFNYLR